MIIGDNWQHRPQPALAALLFGVFILAPWSKLQSENSPAYTGAIDLPVDLVTEQGDRLRKGRFQLQVRVGEGHGSLDFRRKDRTVASVSGRAGPITVPPAATKPLTGTLHMSLPESDSPARGRRDNWFKLKRTWKAAMRVYESAAPRSGTVTFVFQFQPAPGQWSRIEFRLQSAAPAPAPEEERVFGEPC